MSGSRHVYLSPHLDDAVLSCGAHIHQLAQAGEPVLVVTVFAGSPRFDDGDVGLPPSDYIAALHQRWGTGADAPALRRAEDQAALRVLSADFRHLSYLDCIYRQHPVTGEFLYQSDEDILAEVHPADFLLVAELQETLQGLVGTAGQTTIYSPLTAGRHVDHQIVVAAALALQAVGHRVAFYEDYPYAEMPAALEAAMRRVGRENWRREFIPLYPGDLAAKATAVLCYRSQLSTFFDNDAQVAQRLYAYAITPVPHQGPCERIWHLTK